MPHHDQAVIPDPGPLGDDSAHDVPVLHLELAITDDIDEPLIRRWTGKSLGPGALALRNHFEETRRRGPDHAGGSAVALAPAVVPRVILGVVAGARMTVSTHRMGGRHVVGSATVGGAPVHRRR